MFVCVCMNAGTDMPTHYVMYHKQESFEKKTFVVFRLGMYWFACVRVWPPTGY